MNTRGKITLCGLGVALVLMGLTGYASATDLTKADLLPTEFSAATIEPAKSTNFSLRLHIGGYRYYGHGHNRHFRGYGRKHRYYGHRYDRRRPHYGRHRHHYRHDHGYSYRYKAPHRYRSKDPFFYRHRRPYYRHRYAW